MGKHGLRTLVASVGLTALVAIAAPSPSGAAGGDPKPPTPLPVHEVTPVTCSSPGQTAWHTNVRIGAQGPSTVSPGGTFTEKFQIRLDGLVAPRSVTTYSMTTRWGVTSNATPSGPFSFVEANQTVAAGATPISHIFSKSFVANGWFGDYPTFFFYGVTFQFEPKQTWTCTFDSGTERYIPGPRYG